MSEDNNDETITIPMFKNGVIPNFTYIDGHRYFREDALGELKKTWSTAILAELEQEIEKLHGYTDGIFDMLGKDKVLSLIRSKKGGA
jgi:ribosomal protein S2